MDQKTSPPKPGRGRTRRPGPADGKDATPFTSELGEPSSASSAAIPALAEGPIAPRPQVRKEPRKKTPPARTPEAGPESPYETEFDRIVDYREDLAADFDAMAADHPRSAVLGSLALGFGVGLLAGLFLWRE